MLMLDIDSGLKLTQCTKSLEVLNEIFVSCDFESEIFAF